MGHLLPFFTCNSLFDCLLLFIDTHTYDSDIFSPNSLVFLKHFLVMFHGFLARPAPSGPNIDQQNFSWLVGQDSLSPIKNIINLSKVLEWSSSLFNNVNIGGYLKFFQFLVYSAKFFFKSLFKLDADSIILGLFSNFCLFWSLLDEY